MSALDPVDEGRFADHLPGCARCTATVRESLYTVADLAYALPDAQPPPRLRRRIMDLAAAEPRDEPPPLSAATDDDLPHPSAGGPGDPVPDDRHPHPSARGPGDPAAVPGDGHPHPSAGGPGDPVPGDGFEDRPAGGPGAPVASLAARRRRWVRGGAVAAALALIAGLAAWNVRLHSDQDRLRDVVAQRDALVARLTEAGPARVAIIRGPAGTGERRATVVVKQGRLGLITETLPPGSPGRMYWLWSLRGATDAAPVPLAGFTVPETRFSACNIEPPAGVDVTRSFAISEEPGTARPTRPTDLVAFGSTDPG
jgi:hypothetical protein